MIKSIHIQNYKSLKDCTVNLEQVNLLIGANNSGKSNFMKAVYLLKDFINHTLPDGGESISTIKKAKDSTHKKANKPSDNFLFFKVHFKFGGDDFSILIKYNFSGYFFSGIFFNQKKVSTSSEDIENLFEHDFTVDYLTGNNMFLFNDSLVQIPRRLLIDDVHNFESIKKRAEVSLEKAKFFLQGVTIFKPIIDSFSGASETEPAETLKNDASNLIPFLYSLSQNHPSDFSNLIENVRKCIDEISNISVPIIEKGRFRLRFFDRSGNSFFANEVSEGVLYFVAILALIHQPNPPKLILIEEPETGIHPRRIHEIMNFIFQLAEDKDIQVVISSHSPLILEEFRDIPESVSVFDKENGETIIKNLKRDIIDTKNKKMKKAGLNEMNFTDEIGENWLIGMLDGVPND